MPRLRCTFLVAAAVMFVGAIAWTPKAAAHHGWGGYREDVALTLTIRELRLGNPHDRLVAVDADGVEWNLLLAPPARNRRFGFDGNTLSVGEEIELLGQKHPRRNEVKVHCIFRGGIAVYAYRYDDGRSSLKRDGRDERC